jgi:hypothetical protein
MKEIRVGDWVKWQGNSKPGVSPQYGEVIGCSRRPKRRFMIKLFASRNYWSDYDLEVDGAEITRLSDEERKTIEVIDG